MDKETCAVCEDPYCDHNFYKDDKGYYGYFIPCNKCPNCKRELIAEEYEDGYCQSCGLYLESRFFMKLRMDEDGRLL